VKTALTFAALLVTGSLVVLLYIWTGESVIVLLLAFFTIGAGLFLADWRPWDVAENDKAKYRPRLTGQKMNDWSAHSDHDDEDYGSLANSRYPSSTNRDSRYPNSQDPGSQPPEHDDWAGSDDRFTAYDITYDQRGLSGVPEGEQGPQLWAWSQIDDILIDDRYDGQLPSLRLSFPNLRDPSEPAHAWVQFGPDQDPDSVLHEARTAFRDSKIPKSSLYALPSAERTWHLAEAMSPIQIDLSDRADSASYLYREIRNGLEATGSLVAVRDDSPFGEIIETFDGLLIANGLSPMADKEHAELVEIGSEASFAELHWTLDWFAEQRGARIAFLDESYEGQHRTEYLLGLIPAQLADEWDGQTVGARAAQVVLDIP